MKLILFILVTIQLDGKPEYMMSQVEFCPPDPVVNLQMQRAIANREILDWSAGCLIFEFDEAT